MKKYALIIFYIAIISWHFGLKSMAPLAEWTVIDYMQADNNLSSYSNSDIDEMIKGLRQAAVQTDDKINILVQMDIPSDNKTWRFRIKATGKIEDASINQEMGIDPEKELIETARWIKARYPARHYFWILWNHGSGIEDYRTIKSDDGKIKFSSSWIEVPGHDMFENSKSHQDSDQKNNENKDEDNDDSRGILYDDSQNTCLSNTAMTSAFMQIRDILKPGEMLDIIGMDACLMSMLEVFYQLKDCFLYFVGSQQVEAGEGWYYVDVIRPIAESNGSIRPHALCKLIVDAYGFFYIPLPSQNFTQSAIDLTQVENLKNYIDTFVTLVEACAQFRLNSIKDAIIDARLKTLSFDNANYIDLFSFFREVRKSIIDLRNRAEEETPCCCFSNTTAKYISSLRTLLGNVEDTMQFMLTQVVMRNTYGRKFISNSDINANGISIYYPSPNNSSESIHRSYYQTIFARNSRWTNFIKKYRRV